MAVHETQLPRRRAQAVAELVEAVGRDGGQHVPRAADVVAQRLGPQQNFQRIAHLIGAHLRLGVEQLEVQRLEQQLLHLPHDEKAGLVVTLAARVLQAEQQVDALVVDIRVAASRKVNQRRTAGGLGGVGAGRVGGGRHGPGVQAGVDSCRVNDQRRNGLVFGHGTQSCRNRARVARPSSVAGSARSRITSKWLRCGTSNTRHGVFTCCKRCAKSRP